MCAAHDQRRTYRDLTWTWPIISPKEDYIPDAAEFRELLRGRAFSARA